MAEAYRETQTGFSLETVGLIYTLIKLKQEKFLK